MMRFTPRKQDAEITKRALRTSQVLLAKSALRSAEVLLKAPPGRQDPNGALQMVRMALRKIELI
jgi:hypothetical protein